MQNKFFEWNIRIIIIVFSYNVCHSPEIICALSIFEVIVYGFVFSILLAKKLIVLPKNFYLIPLLFLVLNCLAIILKINLLK